MNKGKITRSIRRICLGTALSASLLLAACGSGQQGAVSESGQSEQIFRSGSGSEAVSGSSLRSGAISGSDAQVGSAWQSDQPAAKESGDGEPNAEDKTVTAVYQRDTPISEVQNAPEFGDYGRLLFPVDEGYMSGSTLGDLSLTWYNNIDPDETVEIVNTLSGRAKAGETIFYDIYSDEEKAEDPDKEDTGLFFFRGNPGEKFAICNAGGGFAYVGAMQDSFPHALELSKQGYNAFALIYRSGAQTACEDLARAISFIFAHADELEVDTDTYSLWGGSAGARMAAWLGSYGPVAFGGENVPRPGAVIMQYTGLSDYTADDPPTFACVGENDGIANWRTMQRRLEAMQKQGIPTEFHHYPGLRHGFGLGTGTVAEGWIDQAIAFWEAQM
jgi:acetyl esterase/lipase